jgi:hypothetical protein
MMSESAEEISSQTETDAEPLIEEEIIPLDEDIKPAKKKVAALKARHELEDYFEMKKLGNALDYLFEDEEENKSEKSVKNQGS